MNTNKNLSWSSARNICILKTLAKSGRYPTRKSEKEAWFLSPLRSETQASFSVSLTRNLWYDYGLGKGGNIIDLVILLNNCSAYQAVRSLQENIHFSFCPEKVPERNRNAHQIKTVKPIQHPGLKAYLHSRKIPLKVALPYCEEVWHHLNNKLYFSLGLKNDSGGWELRNKYYKCSVSPKTVSSILKGCPELTIVEGMFDLLSLLTLDRELGNTSDMIVLNSLGNIQKITERFSSYSTIHLYLDNDHAGKQATKKLMDLYPNSMDKSETYKNYKDLNEMLNHENRKE